MCKIDKVLEGMRICAQPERFPWCWKVCPYGENDCGGCAKLREDAMELLEGLKEKETAKPVVVKIGYDGKTEYSTCGSCGAALAAPKAPFGVAERYCHACGQLIKWN